MRPLPALSGLLAFLSWTSTVRAQQAAEPLSAAKRAAYLKSALSAAPRAIAAHAIVLAPGANGAMIMLQQGSNGFVCFPDDPTTPGADPVCADPEAMKWINSYTAHDDQPANLAPGVAYMLAGGSDPSNTEPLARPGPTTKWVITGPHWMLLWPIDPARSGLSTTPKRTGTFIMWAGTPWAHLMINQVP
jgi:hypothetical protein